MKYEKPKIVAISQAAEAIQASLVKGHIETDDDCHGSGGTSLTDCAYIADE
jgi:hypothetical protein